MAYQAKTSRRSIEGTNQSSFERSAVRSNRVCFCTFLLYFHLRDMYCGEGEETSLKRRLTRALRLLMPTSKESDNVGVPVGGSLTLPADPRAVAQELEYRLLASEVRFRKLQSSQEPGHRRDLGLVQ